MADRTLVLLRHAKAEQPTATADLDRPLTVRGYDDAATAGAWLLAHRLVPDLVICSPARRTRQTWHAAATALGAGATGITAVYEPRVYAAQSARELIEVIAATDAEVERLLMIGHNPTLSTLSALLNRGESAEALRPAGIAVHAVDGAWLDIDAGCAPLVRSHTARAS